MSKTAQGLVDYCKAQLGKPYWWGDIWAGLYAGAAGRKAEAISELLHGR